MIAAVVVVRLSAVRRPVAIPVLAKLVIKDTRSASRLWLARRMAEAIAWRCPAAASASWPIPPASAGS